MFVLNLCFSSNMTYQQSKHRHTHSLISLIFYYLLKTPYCWFNIPIQEKLLQSMSLQNTVEQKSWDVCWNKYALDNTILTQSLNCERYWKVLVVVDKVKRIWSKINLVKSESTKNWSFLLEVTKRFITFKPKYVSDSIWNQRTYFRILTTIITKIWNKCN